MTELRIWNRASHLDRKRLVLLDRRRQLLDKFGEATTTQQPRRMTRLCRELRFVNDFIGTLETIDGERIVRSTATAPRYVVSALFLEQCYHDLTADPNEQFFFVTGAETDGLRILSQPITFTHDRRSMVGVTGNPTATHELLIRLDQQGHRLLGHFHSHPGVGAAATRPSGTDERFQRRLEQAGYPTVAAIFSRDGYVRFFRLDDDLDLVLHGTGVETHGDHVYRLTNVHPARRGSRPRGGGPPAAR